MTTQSHTQTPLERLRHHVSGAIARGEAAPVVQITAPATHTPGPWETKRAATPEALANCEALAKARHAIRPSEGEQ